MFTTTTEPVATAILMFVFGALILCSVLFSRTLNKAGVPVVLLFMVLGMLGGSQGIGGVEFKDYELAFRLGTIALVLILFDGGLNTAHSSIRASLVPAGLLATVGVLITAALVSGVAKLLGLSWGAALLVGAIVSSTDAAAVFAVLRGGSVRVKEPLRSTIELESCINDPMAIILTVTLVEALMTNSQPSWWLLVLVPMQLAIGTGVGVLMGYLGRWMLNNTHFATVGLYPAATLAIASLTFGIATVVNGSGFLAVFAAAAVLGNGPLPYKAGLTRVHDAVAWFAQVSMFLMLGLLSFPSRLLDVAGIGLVLGLVLAFVARPAAVAACLGLLGWKRKQIAYTGWIGIRGAVPIVLATIPIMAGVPAAERVFDIVFFIVVFSALAPGASIIPITRRLGFEDPHQPEPAAVLEIHSRRKLGGEVYVYCASSTTTVCDATLAEIVFPADASVLLVVRGDSLLPARGPTRLRVGDFVYIFCKPEEEPMVGLLFGPRILE
tara:strand:- start:103579 stop:105063 length:1485 start_codon:yes stop_codon:yes gene_type:complete